MVLPIYRPAVNRLQEVIDAAEAFAEAAETRDAAADRERDMRQRYDAVMRRFAMSQAALDDEVDAKILLTKACHDLSDMQARARQAEAELRRAVKANTYGEVD